MEDEYYSRLAVSLVLTRINENGQKEILLQLRQNTGYMDNMYDFASSGHVQKGETYATAIVRETKEEIGIDIKEDDLIFLAVNHNYKADHVQLYFAVKEYAGVPRVCEPAECGGLLWANMTELPENINPYAKKVIEEIGLGIQYDDGNFSVFKRVNKKIYKE